MKKFAMLLMALIIGVMPSLGQGEKSKSKDMMHTVVYLKSGQRAVGYTDGMFSYLDSMVYLGESSNRLSMKRKQKYSTSDIDSVEGWYDNKPDERLTFVPRFVNMDYEDNPRMSPVFPSLVIRLYNGRYVWAYMGYDPWFNFRVLYQTYGMVRALSLCKPFVKLKSKDRARILGDFADFPAVANYIKNVDAAEWAHHPVRFFELLDGEIAKLMGETPDGAKKHGLKTDE